jgi:hypothetical protein
MQALLRGLALVSLCAAWPCAAQTYEDWWWNSSQIGHGINIGQQDNTLFISWFTYDEQGQDMWLVASGALSGKTLNADWTRNTGPMLGTPFDPLQVKKSTVGTVTITFADLRHAKMDWTVNGKSGTVDLVRYTWSPITLSPTYYGRSHGVACGGVVEFFDQASLTMTLSSPPGGPQTLHMFDIDSHSKFCDYDGEVTKSGSVIHYTGTYSCTSARGSGTHDTTMVQVGEAITIISNSVLSGGCTGTTTITGLPR